MPNNVLTGDEAEEFQRLYAEYQAAAQRAFDAMWVRLRELQGMGGDHWMA